MSWRRIVFAFAITFVCTLLVFRGPQFVLQALSTTIQTPVQDTAAVAAPVVAAPRSVGSRLTGIFGLVLILGIGFALSRNRKAISWRVVAWGVGLQVAFAVFVLRVDYGRRLFGFLGGVVTKILSFSYAGSEFVFGEIGKQHSSIGVVAAYIAFGIEARHLLTAVIMTAPGTIMMAKILEPETETPETLGGVKVDIPRTDVNVLDAAARGTGEGLHLMLNVIAMLVSFIALIALVNGVFGWIHGIDFNLLGLHISFAWFPESLQTVLGWIFRPIAWVMGVPWHDSGTVGGLLGERMVINEFIAYAHLGPLKATLDPVSFTIATFALCGFANLSSVGIQIGGIGALAPERKHDLARLGLRAMIAGTLANFLSATLAGILL